MTLLTDLALRRIKLRKKIVNTQNLQEKLAYNRELVLVNQAIAHLSQGKEKKNAVDSKTGQKAAL